MANATVIKYNGEHFKNNVFTKIRQFLVFEVSGHRMSLFQGPETVIICEENYIMLLYLLHIMHSLQPLS